MSTVSSCTDIKLNRRVGIVGWLIRTFRRTSSKSTPSLEEEDQARLELSNYLDYLDYLDYCILAAPSLEEEDLYSKRIPHS